MQLQGTQLSKEDALKSLPMPPVIDAWIVVISTPVNLQQIQDFEPFTKLLIFFKDFYLPVTPAKIFWLGELYYVPKLS